MRITMINANGPNRYVSSAVKASFFMIGDALYQNQMPIDNDLMDVLDEIMFIPTMFLMSSFRSKSGCKHRRSI